MIRFANALGFDGFSQMQQVFREPPGRALRAATASASSRCAAARRPRRRRPACCTSSSARRSTELRQLEEHVDPEALTAAVQLLAGAPQIHVLAQRRAFPVACYLAYALQPARAARAPARRRRRHARRASRAASRTGDVLIAASFRNYSPGGRRDRARLPQPRRLGGRHHRQRAVAAEAAPPTSASSSATTRRGRSARWSRRCAWRRRWSSAPATGSPTRRRGGDERRRRARRMRQSRSAPCSERAGTAARRRLHGPRRGRPVRRADRRPARGHALVRALPRRLAGQHRGRRRAARPEAGDAHARRRRAQRPLRARARSPPRASTSSHVHDRPEAAHRAGLPRHPRPRHLPAGLLPRALRRHGDRRRRRRRRRFIASARALLLSGTHLSQPGTLDGLPARDRAGARGAARAIVLDIDYRPVLWGLTAPGLGEQRYVASSAVSARAADGIVAECDLVVGTEEEIRIAGGYGRHAGGAAAAARADARRRSW